MLPCTVSILEIFNQIFFSSKGMRSKCDEIRFRYKLIGCILQTNETWMQNNKILAHHHSGGDALWMDTNIFVSIIKNKKSSLISFILK